MRCSLICMIFNLVLVKALFAQQVPIGIWKNYTDMKSVWGVAQAGTSIWAATGGGVFAFDTITQKFTKYTNSEGLSSNDLRAIAIDHSERIWVGALDGSISVFDPIQHRWMTIMDIQKSLRLNKSIQNLSVQGDTIFVVSQFGVSVFIGSRWEFGDTYANLGFASPPIVNCVVVQGNRIWVGTNSGLATALLTSPNLSAPTSWATYTTFSGFSSDTVTSLAVFNDTLMVGTNSGLVYFANGAFNSINYFDKKTIRELSVNKNKLFVLSTTDSGSAIETLSSVLTTPQTVVSNSNATCTSFVNASSLWIATANKGVAQWSTSGWVYKYPNGPNSNQFSSLVVDNNDVLWCASGGASTAGFYRLNLSLQDNLQWKNFTSAEYPIMKRNGSSFDAYYRMSLGANSSIWVSSGGEGILEVKGDSIILKLNHYSSPRLPGARVDLPDVVICGGAAIDNEGRTWIVCRNESFGHSLLRLDSDTSGTFFDNQYNTLKGWFHSILIDQYGTKWMSADLPWEANGQGLYFFNESSQLNGVQTIGGWGYLSFADGLPSDVVYSFATDLEGSLWIGTGLGVAIIPDPQYPGQRLSSFPLREQEVQTIAVDAVNNKWIGTKKGVFVVNSDGTQLLQTFTVASTNGQLVDDDIWSIAIDQRRGIVYFGTEKGLSSLSIEAVQINRTFSKLEIGPNPFLVPSSQPLIIRNLVANSTIKILTTSGLVVTEFLAQGGGRAFWDGRDRNGKLVSSGIYFVVAYSENGSQVVTGKVAVIRK